jgi:putative ABC transport system permease protein
VRPASGLPGWASALYRLVLRLYPRRFRARYGEEMRGTLEERWSRERASGRSAGRALGRELAALAWAGVRARVERRVPAPVATMGPARLGWVSEEGVLKSAAHDLRFAARALARNPGFSLVVALVLALGVGANTAIFSAVNAVLLSPIPGVHRPDRLVQVWEENEEKGWHKQVAAPANYLDWRAGVAAFTDVAGHNGTGPLALTGEGSPEIVQAGWVTGNFFEVMGVRAALGRTLREEETWADAPAVVVLSDGFWTRRFARDPAVVGRTLMLNDQPYEVVGVAPPGFAFPGEVLDLWMPGRWQRAAVQEVWFRRAHFLSVIARLEDGVTPEEANAQLQVVVQRLQRDYPETNRVMGAGLTPLQEFLVGDARAPLLILLGATALLLLLACANVANLMLVRAAGRAREIALRAALGAGRGRIVREQLAESLLLAGLGGALGVVAGFAGVRALAALRPPDALRLDDVALDARVLAFALVVTLASGVLFGIAPALRGARTDAGATLKDGARTTGGRGTRRASQLLVVTEVALALLLVTGAGLLLRSFVALRRVDPGFSVTDRVAVAISLPAARYAEETDVLAFLDALMPRIERLPGVLGATYTSRLPLQGFAWTNDFAVEGRGPDEYGSEIAHRPVAPDYFDVLGVPLLRGRAFDETDGASGEHVIIINETLSRRFFANEDPIGRRLAFDRVPNDSSVWWRIIGVVGDQRQHGLNVPAQIEAYEPFRLAYQRFFYVVLHTRGDPAPSLEGVRAELAAVDPLLPVMSVERLEDVYATALGRDRFLLTLIGVFAAVALLLATVGVYGVTAEAAKRRTREIGVRVALGARAGGVAALILRQGLALAAAGITLGLVAALAGTRLLASVLFGVSARDGLTFIAVPAVLALAAALACVLPALRAARLDPVRALRQE